MTTLKVAGSTPRGAGRAPRVTSVPFVSYPSVTREGMLSSRRRWAFAFTRTEPDVAWKASHQEDSLGVTQTSSPAGTQTEVGQAKSPAATRPGPGQVGRQWAEEVPTPLLPVQPARSGACRVCRLHLNLQQPGDGVRGRYHGHTATTSELSSLHGDTHVSRVSEKPPGTVSTSGTSGAGSEDGCKVTEMVPMATAGAGGT